MIEDRAFDLDEKKPPKERKDLGRGFTQAVIAADAGVPIKNVRITRRLSKIKGSTRSAWEARVKVLAAEVAVLNAKQRELSQLRENLSFDTHVAWINGAAKKPIFIAAKSYQGLIEKARHERTIGTFKTKPR